jgi:hypothetical protein
MSMQPVTGNRRFRCSQSGAALLIAIFTLLLIAAVAMGLIMMALTQSSISANYKSSLQAFYNARAGLEEGRGRLFSGNANALSLSGFPPALPANQVWYIINPASGETVDPQGSAATYADLEYPTEWGVPLSSASVQPYVASVAALAGTPNAPYKWVRITATTEKSIGIDVNGSGGINTTALLCFDGTQVFHGGSSACPANSNQVFTITALAVTSSGGQRMEQYTVAQQNPNLNITAATTIGANVLTFSGSNSHGYQVDGQDATGSPPPVSSCIGGLGASVAAIGVTEGAGGGSANKNAVIAGIPVPPPSNYNNYSGGGLPNPSVSDSISLPTSLLTPANVSQFINQVSQNADLVVQHDATQSDIPSGMSATSPMTVVVNGNLNLADFTGYGLLIVNGNFTYSGNSGWNGIVIVAGNGTTTFTGNGNNRSGFHGAIFVATIKDALGNILPNFGNVTYDLSGDVGNGVYYNTCWVNKAQQYAGLKLLSFREITN